jgi:hypothetical protein
MDPIMMILLSHAHERTEENPTRLNQSRKLYEYEIHPFHPGPPLPVGVLSGDWRPILCPPTSGHSPALRSTRHLHKVAVLLDAVLTPVAFSVIVFVHARCS